MTTDIFKTRGKALEDEFFRRVDAQLSQQLREKWQHEKEAESLKKETRILDDRVIDELLAVEIHPGMIRALTLVPAIQVAWANGFVEKQERAAILKAAHSVGISETSTTGMLLVSWLDSKPGPELFTAWKDYIRALHDVLDVSAYRHLHENAVQTSQKIAEAAGGFLGIHPVSVAEKRVINEIDEAFLVDSAD